MSQNNTSQITTKQNNIRTTFLQNAFHNILNTKHNDVSKTLHHFAKDYNFFLQNITMCKKSTKPRQTLKKTQDGFTKYNNI